MNASAHAGGAEHAHAALRTVLGYVNADIVEAACTRAYVRRDAIGSDGTVQDPRREMPWVQRPRIGRARRSHLSAARAGRGLGLAGPVLALSIAAGSTLRILEFERTFSRKKSLNSLVLFPVLNPDLLALL